MVHKGVKNVVLGFGILVGIVIFSGCGQSKELLDYLDISFNGMSTAGYATYSIDTDRLYRDIFGKDYNREIATLEQLKEMDAIDKAYSIDFDSSKQLSNGDKIKVTVNVNQDQTKKIRGGTKTFEVEGLDEPTELTGADLEKYLIVNFNGASGRGEAKIDNIFDNDLKNIIFEIQNNGNLKNGDHATIEVTDVLVNQLAEIGYIPEENLEPFFEVKELDNITSSANEIANLVDVERMIDEGIHRRYASSPDNSWSWNHQYEITEHMKMYRQFKSDNDDELKYSWWGSSGSGNGNLVKIFSVKQYEGGENGKLLKTQTVAFGFTDIILDSENKANVANIIEIHDVKDETYSLDSVIKLYEGYGYLEVE